MPDSVESVMLKLLNNTILIVVGILAGMLAIVGMVIYSCWEPAPILRHMATGFERDPWLGRLFMVGIWICLLHTIFSGIFG